MLWGGMTVRAFAAAAGGGPRHARVPVPVLGVGAAFLRAARVHQLTYASEDGACKIFVKKDRSNAGRIVGRMRGRVYASVKDHHEASGM